MGQGPAAKHTTQPAAAASSPGRGLGCGVQGQHTPLLGTEPCSGAAVLSQPHSYQEEERGGCSASGGGTLTFLASWPSSAPSHKVCPCLLSPGIAVCQKLGHLCSRAWEELLASLQVLGTWLRTDDAWCSTALGPHLLPWLHWKLSEMLLKDA